MSSNNKAGNAGASAGNAIQNAFHKIHGAGEAIRGNINTFADSATHTDSSHSEAVTQRGLNEMDGAKVGRQTNAPPAGTAMHDAGVQTGGGGSAAHAATGGGVSGGQYERAGDEAGPGQSGTGLAQAMHDGSGADKDAASGGVYQGARPL